MQTEIVPNPVPPRSKLTGGRKWIIAGLLVLQIPSSLIFYPLAAIFAITGIFVPIAMVLMGIGTLPFSLAMRYKERWQGSGRPTGAGGPTPPEGAAVVDPRVGRAPRNVPDGWIA